MIKVRLHGKEQEIKAFKDKLAEDYNLLNVSEVYADRGNSQYSRVYIDLDEYKEQEETSSYPIKIRNVDKLKELVKLGMDALKDIKEFPKNILVHLLEIAIEKIDELQNGGEYDERDMKDMMCDAEFIFEDLIKELESRIDTGIYEEEKKNG